MASEVELQQDPLDLAAIDTRCRWQLRPPDDFPAAWACEWGFDRFGLWQSFAIEGIKYRMRYIPPGRFLMGSPPQEPERLDNELQHAVTLSRGFWLGATTITQALWQAVMGDNPSRFKSDAALPVDSVSWDDGQAFFARVERLLPGLALTFPTEAQWEYACRVGSQTPFASGPQLTTGQANYDGDYPYTGGNKGVFRGKTVAVDAFAANAWGLYQMHGNLWEWCLDDMREYSAQPQPDPLGDTGDPKRALRGGSWDDYASACRSAYRSAYRYAYERAERDDFIGLRAARSP